ncbi:MAG: hypothetical protein KZQ95_14550 [Candidatus Thiodiazotropha sp. (ex Epidulcina cf. delphinae)]|nr:hypothetical protein [Candidatus Thiodiazotropha sp. (ex Epidulcina cf. delphinae)]
MLTKAIIDEQALEVYSVENKCAIQFNEKGDSKLLSIPYPCGFVRASKEKVVQTHYYKGIGHVLVVAGPPADKTAYRGDVGVSPEHMCSNHGQAIILDKGEIILRKAQQVPLGFCHYLGFDEKVFYGYAYPID